MRRRFVVEICRADVRVGRDEGSANVRFRWRYLMSFDDRRLAEKVVALMPDTRCVEVTPPSP